MKGTEQATKDEVLWMRRAGSISLIFIPTEVRERIIRKGFGERNIDGTFNLTAKGKAVLLWNLA